jgi:hypothetical protein
MARCTAPRDGHRTTSGAASCPACRGRTIGVPLAWFPRLTAATPAQRAAVTLSPLGLHWEALDEDVSVAGLTR